MKMKFHLLGDPIAHSISPHVYSAAFSEWGIDAEYEVSRVSSDDLSEAMRNPQICGGNVTLPHKILAASIVDEMSDEVQATGACNCYWRTEGGVLSGANTDVAGLTAALGESEFDVLGSRVLLLGAGGAARAALHALVEGGVSSVAIQNRTLEPALALKKTAPNIATLVVEGEVLDVTYDLVVNATRLGLKPTDPDPIDLGMITCKSVYDMVYIPGKTAWVRSAIKRGIPASDGLGMLIMQAALSLRHWFPDQEPPIQAMRTAARVALEEA